MIDKMEYYTPEDNEEMTEKHKIEKGGVCGQACLSVIERKPIQEVMHLWSELGLEWKGWSGWKQLKEYLEKRNHEVKLKRMSNLGTFHSNCFYILRIQWIGEKEDKEKPFYGWGHWSEASAHTHFIVVENNRKFFCNDDGCWININELDKYLKHYNGVITSAMEVKSKQLCSK